MMGRLNFILRYFSFPVCYFTMTTVHEIKTATFGTKGHVVIPSRMRRELSIERGTKAAVVVTPEGILIKPVTPAYIKSLRGSLKGKGVLKAMMEGRRRERPGTVTRFPT